MWLLVLIGLLGSTGALAAQDTRALNQPLAVSWDATSFRPTIRVGSVLADGELERAARSGLPIRVRVRVELWRDRFFDELVDSTSWSDIIGYEPIARQFFVRHLPGNAPLRTFPSYAAARAALESVYRPALRPERSGRFYYTVSLQIETLSVSDLDELERWLHGELQPAVSGQQSVPSALGQGAKRLMLRLLDLPAHRFDARTGRFTVQ